MHVLVAIFGHPVWTISHDAVERLRALAPGIRFTHATTREAMLTAIGEADVAFSRRVDAEALARAPRLRWIHTPAAGVHGLITPELRARGILVTNARGASASAVAEHALALLLALTRRLQAAMAFQTEGHWAQEEIAQQQPRVLRGLTLAVIGLGSIGSLVAAFGQAFGMRVIGVRRHPERGGPAGVEVHGIDHLATALRQADAIVLAAPHTDETEELIAHGQFAAMKPGALLVNVARGTLVDEAALVQAVRSGRIAGAALDVVATEPLAADSPLWSLPNVIVTPHVAGLQTGYWDIAVDLFLENLGRFQRGDPLRNLIDPDDGY